MTRVVAVDVSAWWGGVALVEESPVGPVTVAELGLLVRDSHAVHLLRVIDVLLAEAGWPRSSVDAYAATRGPGSFTGLRVGLGTVIGLSLAAGRPSIGVGTLEAAAAAFGPSDGERVPLLDAGRGDVFGARYDPDGFPPLELEAPWLGPPGRAVDALEGRRTLFGPGADAHRERLLAAGAHVRIAAMPSSVAGGAGRIASVLVRAGALDAGAAGMAPLYLRPADAQIGGVRRSP